MKGTAVSEWTEVTSEQQLLDLVANTPPAPASQNRPYNLRRFPLEVRPMSQYAYYHYETPDEKPVPTMPKTLGLAEAREILTMRQSKSMAGLLLLLLLLLLLQPALTCKDNIIIMIIKLHRTKQHCKQLLIVLFVVLGCHSNHLDVAGLLQEVTVTAA